MNKVILIGNLTRDPELSETPSGVAVCRFSIAVSRDYANSEGNRETDFFNITVWRGRAENCGKYLRKGSKVGVCGSIQTKTYETSDGVKRYTVEVVADEVQFLSTRAESEVNELPEAAASNLKPAAKIADLKPVEGDEDLPF